MSAAVKPEDPGWPRPWADFRDNDGTLIARLPAPWITGEKATSNDWLSFGEAAPSAHYERLCAVCGERMHGTVVLGRSRETLKMTSGPGMHPRCAALAVAACPLLAKMPDPVCWAYDGPTNGYRLEGETNVYTVQMDGSDLCTEVDNVYTSDLWIKRNARPLNREALKQLAKTDPLGVNTRVREG